MAKACSSGKIGLHMISGLGDAARRVYEQTTNTDLKDFVEVRSIVDIYSAGEVLSDPSGLIERINPRLRVNFTDGVKNYLVSGILNDRIHYFEVERENPNLPEAFFGQVEEGDLVNICAPNNLHRILIEQSIRGLRYPGVLIVEKPVVSSVGEADRLAQFLRTNGTNGIILKDAEHYAHYPPVTNFIERLEEFVERYGKIIGIDLKIEESEGYDIPRNRSAIDKRLSGWGAWLDMGVHGFAFVNSTGAEVNYDSIQAKAFKCNHPAIQGDNYGETEMHVEGNIFPGERFADNCYLKISVGKAMPRQNKTFDVYFERGRVNIEIKSKSMEVWNGKLVEKLSWGEDAFYMVIKDSVDCARSRRQPRTNINNALKNVQSVFKVYDHCRGIEQVPMQLAA